MKVLFLFVDGVGLTAPGPNNPVNERVCPVLYRLLQESAVALDPNMDMPGLPQSATGQAALYTGVNAARHMGRHMEGFPGPTLRAVVETDNIMKTLVRRGLNCCFADAYYADEVEDIRSWRFKSVTTVMGLTEPSILRLTPEMLSNQAVFHDLTRQSIVSKGYTGPVITPTDAADHLLHITLSHDFTLFEFFISDLAGHSQNYDQAAAVLSSLDTFIGALLPTILEKRVLFILTSDHGNIEDLGTRGHTRNPIPLVALGPGADILLRNAKSITDVAPLLLSVMASKG